MRVYVILCIDLDGSSGGGGRIAVRPALIIESSEYAMEEQVLSYDDIKEKEEIVGTTFTF